MNSRPKKLALLMSVVGLGLSWSERARAVDVYESAREAASAIQPAAVAPDPTPWFVAADAASVTPPASDIERQTPDVEVHTLTGFGTAPAVPDAPEDPGSAPRRAAVPMRPPDIPVPPIEYWEWVPDLGPPPGHAAIKTDNRHAPEPIDGDGGAASSDDEGPTLATGILSDEEASAAEEEYWEWVPDLGRPLGHAAIETDDRHAPEPIGGDGDAASSHDDGPTLATGVLSDEEASAAEEEYWEWVPDLGRPPGHAAIKTDDRHAPEPIGGDGNAARSDDHRSTFSTDFLSEQEASAARPLPDSPSSASAMQSSQGEPKIVVATHADKVLLSLAALHSESDAHAGRFGAQTKEIVVATQAEKVLLNLDAVRMEGKGKRRGAASGTPIERESPHVQAAEVDSVLDDHRLAPRAVDPVGEYPDAEHRDGLTPRNASRPNAMGAGWLALNESKMDQVRGGFTTTEGLQISFGIERAVYVNGSLVTTTSLNVSELGKVSAGQAEAGIGAAAAGLALLQSGTGNTFQPGPISASSVGTVIQNVLDGQKIQSITVINATVNSMQVLKSMNLQSSLRSAITDSLRR